MNRFGIAKPIVACHVNKNLLNELEDYIKNEIPKLIGVSKKNINEKYSIYINDKIGEEEIESISNYSLSVFPDSTKRIEINVRLFLEKYFIFSISFDSEYSRKYESIKISYESNNAREIALGVYEGINRIIESHRNNNEFFHPSLGIESFIYYLKYILLGFSIPMFLINRILFLIPFLIFLGIIIYEFTGKVFKRYITFETNYNTKLQKLFKFYWSSLLSLVLLILGIVIAQNWNRLLNLIK
jgi:hypothetical protein